MKNTWMAAVVSILILASGMRAETVDPRTPYLEAAGIAHDTTPDASDLQRELVLLSVQTRLTPSWPGAYRRFADTALEVGRSDLAGRALQKILTLTKINAKAQLELMNLEGQGYQTSEARRQFLNSRLKGTDLLPQVVSDIYRQLAQIAWQDYENPRARKYLELAIKRMAQNVQAWQLLSRMVKAEKDAGATDVMATRVGELQARVMVNPLDAEAAVELAILAGKADLPDAMADWLGQAKKIQSEFQPTQPWPESVRIDLAESMLAAGQADKAVEILQPIVTQSGSTGPATRPAERTARYYDIHARILLGLSAQTIQDDALLAVQQDWFDRFTRVMLEDKAASTKGLILASLWYSLYSPEPDYFLAVRLARKAVKGKPGNAMAKITLALSLARSGETVESLQLLDELGESANPLVTLAQISLSLTRNERDNAQALVTKGLENTPYGPLRSAMLALAKEMKLATPPTPKLAGVRDQLNGFDQNYLISPDNCAKLVELDLSSRGQMTRGEICELTMTLRNRGNMILAIGAGSLIDPYIAIEIKTTPDTQRPILHYVPIDSRLLLEPGNAISVTALLNEVNGWDSFVANRNDQITRVEVQASVVATVPFGSGQMITLTRSPKATVALPQISRKNANAMIAYLQGNVTRTPWQTARLGYWLLLASDLSDRHPAIIEGMTNQLKQTNPPATRSAFAWALRAGKADGRVFNTIAAQLGDDDWLVRFMCLDTLGQLQGETAKKLFEYYAVKDCDSMVRQLSTSYLMVK